MSDCCPIILALLGKVPDDSYRLAVYFKSGIKIYLSTPWLMRTIIIIYPCRAPFVPQDVPGTDYTYRALPT